MKISYHVPDGVTAATIPLADTDRGAALETIARELGFACHAHLHQVHSGTTVQVPPIPGIPPDADAVVCTESGILLGVFTADCVPVLLYGDGFAGVIHAGWRGFVNGIFESWFAMAPSKPEAMRAIIGPAICGACYEVSAEVANQFNPSHVRSGRPGHAHLDLKGAARRKLITAGIKPHAIDTHPACTRCTPTLHSYRRNRTPLRNLSVIGWQKRA